MLGSTVSHYRILGKLGGGGMGVVYGAEDLKLGRQVALKFLPEELTEDPVTLRRFDREARTASALNHPNICTIYDIDKSDGRTFIAMELLEGKTLTHAIEGKALRIDTLLEVAVQVCEGLHAAHSANIIHRDIKPGNVFVTKSGLVKLLDFGLAKVASAASVFVGDATTALTGRAVAVGTLAYMSPEQVRNEELDARTDLFSFGVVLYEMATGALPFRGPTYGALAHSILGDTPPDAVRINPEVPPELQEIICKALERDRQLRYQHASDLCADLKRLRRELQSGQRVTSASAVKRARISRTSWKGLAVLVFAVAIVATALFVAQRRRPALTEKDSLVLADFDNRTGDPVFDDTLKQALAVQLEQSPSLNVLSDQKINAELQLMGRQPGERLTPEIGRDLCQRVGSKAMLAGSIAMLGNEYVIGLVAIECSTGASLAREQAEAGSKERVLNAVGRTATDLRARLGESLTSIQKFATPVEEATTPSLEALQSYSVGVKTFFAKGATAARPLYEHAAELDPNFAMAYARLSAIYYNLQEPGFAAENARRAHALRARVSEHERFYLDAQYHSLATGDLEKAVQVFQVWHQTYPRDPVPCNNLSLVLQNLGRYEEALESSQEAQRLEPNAAIIYANLGFINESLDRLDAAEKVYRDVDAHQVQHELVLVGRYLLAFLTGDASALNRLESTRGSTAEREQAILVASANTERWHGRFAHARELTLQAVASAERNAQTEAAANYLALAVLPEAEVGQRERAKSDGTLALRSKLDMNFQALVALGMARAGDPKAELVTSQLNKRFPTHTLIQLYWLPTIRAATALQHNNPAKAISELEMVRNYELGTPMPGSVFGLTPMFMRGQAYLMQRNPTAAAEQFQQIINRPGLVGNFPLGALARLGLARSFRLAGDKARSRAAYREFLDLWTGADADIPLLQQAKAEYANLR